MNSVNNMNSVNIWDINSIINYLINHYDKFLLLILAFFIIYIVDHISNINAAIYGVQSVIPNVTSNNITNSNNIIKTKKSKGKSK